MSQERLTETVLRLAADRLRAKFELTAEQAAVARWLGANPQLVDDLEELLRSRIEARGALPVPSTPTEAHLDRARDHECRAIIGWLRLLQKAPLPGPFDIPGSKE